MDYDYRCECGDVKVNKEAWESMGNKISHIKCAGCGSVPIEIELGFDKLRDLLRTNFGPDGIEIIISKVKEVGLRRDKFGH